MAFYAKYTQVLTSYSLCSSLRLGSLSLAISLPFTTSSTLIPPSQAWSLSLSVRPNVPATSHPYGFPILAPPADLAPYPSSLGSGPSTMRVATLSDPHIQNVSKTGFRHKFTLPLELGPRP